MVDAGTPAVARHRGTDLDRNCRGLVPTVTGPGPSGRRWSHNPQCPWHGPVSGRTVTAGWRTVSACGHRPGPARTQEFRLRPGAVAVPGDSDRPLTGQRDRASPISEPSLGCRESDSRFHFGPAELLPVLPEGAAGMGFRLVHAQSALSRAFQSLVRRGIAKV